MRELAKGNVSSSNQSELSADLFAQGRYAEAASELESELRVSQHFAQTFGVYAGVLLTGDLVDQLIRFITDSETRLLESRETAGLCAAILRINSKLEDADRFERVFKELGGRQEQFLSIAANVARIRGKADLHLDFLFELAMSSSENRNKGLLQYTNCCFQYLEYERAEAARELVNPEDPLGEIILANLDTVKGDASAVLDRVERWLSDPNSSPNYASVIENLWCSAGIPELGRSMRAAMHKWSDNPTVTGPALLYRFVDFDERDSDGRRLLEKVKVTERNHLSVIEAEIDSGNYYEATRLLERTNSFSTVENDRRRKDLLQLSTTLSSLELPRELVVDTPDSDWLLSPSAESGKLCVVFTGLNGRPTLGVQALDRFLASLGYQALYLRDFNRLAYAKGILSQGETQAEALSAISRLALDIGAPDPVFLGASLGAIGAVDFGLKLNVDRILAFGYHDRSRSQDRWRLGDSRAPILAARENLHARGDVRSLKDHLNAANNDAKVDLFYNPANVVDAFYARSFSGLRSVSLHPVQAGKSHDCLRAAMLQGQLDEYF